jgi:adhesin HecA-like repeat protein
MAAPACIADAGAMLRRKHTLIAAATTCAALTVPAAVASARDFCVGNPAGCTGTAVPVNGLANALSQAATNGTDDRVLLGVTSFENGPLSYNSIEKLELIGAGAGHSILRSTAAGTVFTLGGNPDSRVSNLTVQPAGDASGALALNGTRADGAAVDAAPEAPISIAVLLTGGARFSHGRVDMSQDAPAVASVDTASVVDSSIKAPHGTGVIAAGSEMTIRRGTLDARVGALVGKGHLTISDTLVDLRGKSGVGVAAGDAGFGGGTIGADLDRLTIVGSTPATDDAAGVVAKADGAATSVTVHLRDSVISGLGVPLARLGTSPGVANISTDRSDYLSSVSPAFDVGPGSIVEQRRLTVSPRFVNPAAGDFDLAADSPLVDAGTPGIVPAEATDRDGRPRASDGDGNCTHVPDIGAFEYQGTKVRAVAGAAAATVATGQAVGFSADGSCIPGPGVPTIGWSFDDGATATGAAVTHAFATPGRHTATVTVSDGHGHQARATAGVDVTAAPATPAAPSAAAPVISRLRIAPARIQIGTLLPKLVRKPARRPVGTIRFTLSKAATVQLRFARLGRHGKASTVNTRVGIKARRGVNRIRFAARLSRKVRLKPGAYRLTMIATDAAGARSKRATTRFTAISAQRG